MGAILLKIWNFLKVNNRWAIALALILLLGSGVIIHFKNKKIDNLQAEVKTEVKLREALLDSVKYYQNTQKELVAEKLTIQETIKKLEKMNGQLTSNQKELLARVEEINKKNSIISAALIVSNFKIDSLLHVIGDGSHTTVDTTKKIITFDNLAAKDTSFVYDIEIGKVLPQYPNILPTLLFKSIEIPNKQFVEFHWKNEKKKGYPISFSISNSNKYIKVTNLDSYAIPPLDKLVLNPSGWDKFGNFVIKNGKTIMYIGIGAGVGAGTYWLLTK